MFKDFLEYDSLLKIAVVLSAAFLLVLILAIVISSLIDRKRLKKGLFSTRDLCFAAVCLSSAFALSYLGFEVSQGARVTLASSMPIMIFCYFYGFRRGVLVCTAFMLLQFLQNPFIVHPMSAVLDYVIPFLSLIAFGVFANKNKDITTDKNVFKAHYRFLIATALYFVLRYFSHVLSGVIFYSEYAWNDLGALAYSLGFNAAFFVPDCFIAVACGFLLLASKPFYRFMATSCYALQNTNTAQKDN